MPRGSKPGERRGGRQKGVPNKATADIRAIAQQYGERAINRLVAIMENDEAPHAAQVAATRELLNRGFGQSPMSADVTNSDGSLRVNGYAVVPEQAQSMVAWTQATASRQTQTEE